MLVMILKMSMILQFLIGFLYRSCLIEVPPSKLDPF